MDDIRIILTMTSDNTSNAHNRAGVREWQAIGNLNETHLPGFFNRVCYRKGRTIAVSATARKLAVTLWNMAVKKIPCKPPADYLFPDQERKLKPVAGVRKQIAKFRLTKEDFGFVTD